ncbi:MAG: hypothetical protein ACI93T_001927, partial [Porticoccaceae bacterium]
MYSKSACDHALAEPVAHREIKGSVIFNRVSGILDSLKQLALNP